MILQNKRNRNYNGVKYLETIILTDEKVIETYKNAGFVEIPENFNLANSQTSNAEIVEKNFDEQTIEKQSPKKQSKKSSEK